MKRLLLVLSVSAWLGMIGCSADGTDADAVPVTSRADGTGEAGANDPFVDGSIDDAGDPRRTDAGRVDGALSDGGSPLSDGGSPVSDAGLPLGDSGSTDAAINESLPFWVNAGTGFAKLVAYAPNKDLFVALRNTNNVTIGSKTIAPQAGDVLLVRVAPSGQLTAVEAYARCTGCVASVTGLATDANGDVILAGWVQGAGSMAAVALSPLSAPSVAGKVTGFVLKIHGATLTPVWLRTIGVSSGTVGTIAYANVVAKGGHIGLLFDVQTTGAGTIELPAVSGTTLLATDSGTVRPLIVSLDSADGHARWAKQLGGDGNVQGSAIGADPSGDLYITTASSATSVKDQPTNSVFDLGKGWLLAKYAAADGHAAWGKAFTGCPTGAPTRIDASASRVAVVGARIAFGSFACDLGNGPIGGASNTDGVVALVNPSTGATDASFAIGGSAVDGSTAVVVDGSDAIVAGIYRSADFSWAGTALSAAPAGETALYVGRVSTAGAVVNHVVGQTAVQGSLWPESVAVGPNGRVAIAASLSGTLVLASRTLGAPGVTGLLVQQSTVP